MCNLFYYYIKRDVLKESNISVSQNHRKDEVMPNVVALLQKKIKVK